MFDMQWTWTQQWITYDQRTQIKILQKIFSMTIIQQHNIRLVPKQLKTSICQENDARFDQSINAAAASLYSSGQKIYVSCATTEFGSAGVGSSGWSSSEAGDSPPFFLMEVVLVRWV